MYDEIKEIEIELNTICQSFCPVCVRYVVGPDENNQDILYKNPGVVFNQVLDIVHIKNLFTSSLLSNNYLMINLIGTAGEPLAHPKFLDIVKIIVNARPKAIFNIHTNGGIKSPAFFKALAKTLPKRHRVCFSFDGIDAETNSIYRIGVDWDKAQKNMRTFIEAGGNATWQFIIFDHNRHQLDAARKLAKQLGCGEFESRENISPNGINPAIQASTRKIDMKTPAVIRQKPNFELTLPEYTYIDNQCFDKQGIFLGPDSRIWPCCMMPSAKAELIMVDIWKEASQYEKWGDTWNLLSEHTLEEIMSHPWWEQLRSWITQAEEPCKLCIHQCGGTGQTPRLSDIHEITDKF